MNHCSALAPAEHCRHWTVWEVSCQADATSQSLPICSQQTATGKMLHITSKYWKHGRKRDIPLLPPLSLQPANTSRPTDDACRGMCRSVDGVTAACFSGGPRLLLQHDLDICEWSWALPCTMEESLSEQHPNQLRHIAPRQDGVKGTACSCLGQPPRKAPGQGWLFSLVFQAPRFGLVSPGRHPVWKLLLKGVTCVSFKGSVFLKLQLVGQKHWLCGHSLAVSTVGACSLSVCRS